ncbi:unnamed protein product [Mycena citricolor]|uniref:Uncharacterized protein n=1 Tax=Mycena citricolor TaxID=2018698 RepID=A0AAD2JYY4_9AGAR|nr:unnamed protein product [Mycena citricolor]
MSHPTTLLQATSRVNSQAEEPLGGSPSLEHPLPAKPDVRTRGDREWKRKRVDSQNNPRGGQREDAGRAGHGRGNRRALPFFKKISACTLPPSTDIKESTAFQTGEGGGRGTLSAVPMPPVMAAGQLEVVPGDTFEDLHNLALIATITQSLPDPRHLTARLQIIERASLAST